MTYFVSSSNTNVYKLPTVRSTQEKVIVDPFTLFQTYELPTKQIPYIPEIVEPLLYNKVPVESPAPTGRPIVEKQTMPWLMRIRHKKMKKHKLKKLRRRMMFVYRRRKMLKAKKREKELVLIEKRWKSLASEFDADVFVQDNITNAKKGGWGIDILAERQDKMNATTDTKGIITK